MAKKAKRHFQKPVLVIGENATAVQAAEQMERHDVGCLVVVDEEQQPIGVVTDRDLVLRVLAEGRDGERTRVAAVMSMPAITVAPSDSFETVLQRLRKHGLRRLPVVEKRRLVGMITLDDVLVALAGEFHDVAAAARRAVARAPSAKAAIDPSIRGYMGWGQI